MQLGILIPLNRDIENEIKKVHDLGFKFCQLSSWDKTLYTDEFAKKIVAALHKYDVTVSTFWCGWSGPAVWDFYEGPLTLGLVPESLRWKRINEIKKGSDFAKKLGIKNLATHVGFLPETPLCTQYHSIISALKNLVLHIKSNNQFFLFETGQETPTTLRRAIEDIGEDNIGVNLDPANLIMYGKSNPVDAISILGSYIRDIHGKDGCYPTNGKSLGNETPLGQGKVDYPTFIHELKQIGYDKTITIEREISGEEQIKDIKNAKTYLEKLMRGE